MRAMEGSVVLVAQRLALACRAYVRGGRGGDSASLFRGGIESASVFPSLFWLGPSASTSDKRLQAERSVRERGPNSIHGICRVRNKDIRKFLDGIYVSEKATIEQE